MTAKFCKTIIALLISSLIPTLATAYSPPVENGILWLSANQNADGSWGNNADLAVLDTSTVLDAYQSFNVSTPAYSNGVTWLSAQSPLSTDFLSRRAATLYLSGVDISADLTTLVAIINSDGGWGGDADSTSMINDTSLALQALKAVNYPDQNLIYSAINYLKGNQNADGGWGLKQGDDSEVYYTALVLYNLSQFKSTYDLQTEINKAVAYLFTKQNPVGSFGNGTVYETALVFEALISSGAVGAEHATALQNAIAYLTSTQLPNGSWNDDPYSTALALRALAYIKPNLSISSSDITFSNPTPTVGETITINAVIHNTGLDDAPSTGSGLISVQFYDGDPNSGGVLISETTIPSIPPYESSSASINWTVPTASTQIVYVFIDPLNSIDELDEEDNSAYKALTSATLPDLSISYGDITFGPVEPMPGDAVVITATIRNKGETSAGNVTIDIYDGDPVSGGVLIGNAMISSIGVGGSASVSLTATFTAGDHDISVIVDKNNSIAESSKANNAVMEVLTIGHEWIDLKVTGDNIIFNPAHPREGDTVKVSADIQNQGEAAAEDILVKFYLGDPDAGGVQIGPTSVIMIPHFPARSWMSVTQTWDSTGYEGDNKIFIVVDPINTVTETNEFNNRAFRTLQVASKSIGPDLIISQEDMNIIPQTSLTGAAVTITANIRNTGIEDASNVLVEFTLGSREEGGTLIIGSQTIPFIAQGGSAVAQITWNSTGFTGDFEIFVNTDPFNEIPELSEINNMAHMPITITALQGPDLTIKALDTANLITDTQSLQISGAINLTLENKGNQDTIMPFTITAFEDSNGNEKLDRGTDNILGETTYTGSLAPGASDIINISASGNLLFRDSLIYVLADSNSVIAELDETNNIRHTGQECEYIPPVGSFNPVEKWRWTGIPAFPSFKHSMAAVNVAKIADTDDNGVIDDKDVPAVIINASSIYYRGAILIAVRGDTGEEIFTISDPAYRIAYDSAPATGDIDGDGLVEIVATKDNAWTIAFEHDGKFKWESPYGASRPGGLSIADLDNDGKPEIIIGATVLNNDGTLKWREWAGRGSNDGGALSIVADIDLDGYSEVVAGNTVYRHDGTYYWWKESIAVPDGFNAVANFDNDPYAEIVLVARGSVYLFEHDGTIKWGPVAIPGGGRGGPPTIADFDGDENPEIGVAGYSRYTVFDTDGSILWQSVIKDYSSNFTGSSVFDFDGDGRAEVAYADEIRFRIYNGKTGEVLFETPNSSQTVVEYPVIADVDNDNRAEIIFPANNYAWGDFHGVRVFEDASDNWVNTRKIWNQHSYHITNINDDGTIPRHEQNNWDIYNNYRCNSLLPEEVNRTSDITVSYITVDQTNYPSSVNISARIGNGGAVSHPAGVEVKFYDGEPLQGGILLGTTFTTEVIEKGAYEDVSVIWNAPSAGEHNIYVVADEANVFNECREGNNTANALLYLGVSQPPDMPDLEISQSDITIIPAETVEGQASLIRATIHNIGTSGASDVIVSFYDGDPQSGGILIGSVTTPLIDAGGDALTEIAWNTIGQTGTNYIHVLVDEQNLIVEPNENNNSAIIVVDVISPTIPDLAITSGDIAFSHQSPKEGDSLAITATIHNLGTDAGNIKVNLYDGAPQTGGTLLKTYTISPIISFGGSAQVTFNIDTVGFGGAHSFYIVIDPDNAIIEQNEDNNTASSDIFINSIGLGLTEATDKTQYADNENVLITVNLSDLQNESRELIVDVKIIRHRRISYSLITASALNAQSA